MSCPDVYIFYLFQTKRSHFTNPFFVCLFWIRRIIKKLCKYWGLFLMGSEEVIFNKTDIIRIKFFHFCSITSPWFLEISRFLTWETVRYLFISRSNKSRLTRYLDNLTCSWLCFCLSSLSSVSCRIGILFVEALKELPFEFFSNFYLLCSVICEHMNE